MMQPDFGLKPTQVARRAAAAGRLVTRHGALALNGRLRRVPMNLIRDEFGFSLTQPGWHPFVALLDDLAEADDPRTTTDFERFFGSRAANAVRNLNDLLDLGRPEPHFGKLPGFWLGTYPWGGLAADEIGQPGPAFGWAHDEHTGESTAARWGSGRTVWYRPGAGATLANERRLTTELAASITAGYRPLKARGFPRLTLLRRADGAYRAVIVDGHHRLAVLAHLGVTRVLAEIEAVVDHRDAAAWFHVRSGHCTAAQARQFFDAFFQLDGSEQFDHVAGEWR